MAAMDSAHVKEKCDVLNRLDLYAELSDKQMKQFKLQVIEDDCLRRFYPANLPCLQEKYIRPDGTPHLFEDVPLEKIIETAETYIGELVPADKRAQVFRQVMDGIVGVSKTPYWEAPLVSHYSTPETQFSLSRVSSGEIKTNSQLIEDLVSAADLGPQQSAVVHGQIAWWADRSDEDVPNYFVRDYLMDYINCQIEEDKREHARKYVFSDLGTSEVLEYAALMTKKREEWDQNWKREGIIDDIIGKRCVRTRSEAKHIWEQADVMGDINVNIDLTPRPGFAFRTHDLPLSGSVLRPGQKVKFPVENKFDCGTEIDQDCDQIRAMIKILTCNRGEWTLDQFRLALGHITRPQLTSFLEKRGPKKGVYSLSYQLGWNFFKLREMLGCPLVRIAPPGSPHGNGNVLQERDPNCGQKRLSTGEEGEQSKFQRTLSPIHEIPNTTT
ncbi:uncharacterized protein F4807DRAFT_383591 [Annulohypoxylon truncatum]|uniref:uncharacterized protein n=1 Tax=Annulohypoxylon truncatum TaxID=327061 RepID=UPI00200779D4|nr:uncharacterized protein F4807DRAFT_383591 [Annulohypoxylon truncatum]KAI1211975.1 hypothetical protein F4807DRAFT_383591 [Annulohypoxylon truncatum]